ncbi:hypothetical protein [Plebeiibacterium marinum]|uniref:Carboxypeptidase-like regulatory domain-containing protein n=1 Tax=Plebeiibacterium marinum TaxID=2992111 RepID=A0AAE3SJ48_9BACT|nr:hypothetical protein [Plebeiobacterium marinum]MCW3805043.1 carboxypeptidase-like regulatory domain-containing protein [Plebeiobacterium marinum]
MKRIYVLALVLCLLLGSLSAQVSDSLLFRGVVMEGDSLFALPYAKYTINSDRSYVSNELGQFSFWGKNGDVVHFSYVGFESLYVAIHDSLANDNFLMGVFLSRDTIVLSEVVIIPQTISPGAYARNMPLLSTKEEAVAQHNVDVSTYQAITQPVKEWDAEMNQKNFIQARTNDVVYKGQVQPGQMVGIGNVAVQAEIERVKLSKKKKPSQSYITLSEWEFLIATYHERLKMKQPKP